jgi:hypothetical protein
VSGALVTFHLVNVEVNKKGNVASWQVLVQRMHLKRPIVFV